MSTTVSEVRESSKKRKSQEDQQKAHKKRKHDKDPQQPNGITDAEDEAAQPLKRDKKKDKDTKREKKKDQATILVPNSDTEPAESSQKEKKKKKRKEQAHEAIVIDEAQEPIVVEENDNDIAMEDAPAQDDDNASVVLMEHDLMSSSNPTAFHSIRTSLYLPLPPHGTSYGLNAMLSLHLAPLLLSYFPPLQGVVLAYSNASLSAKPRPGPNLPLLPLSDEESKIVADETTLARKDTGARLGDEFGATWAWLTATFLVFRPAAGDELPGVVNAKSEGFIGLISYNYFQSAISEARIPKSWTWSGPSRQRKKGRKGKLNDSQEPSEVSEQVRADDAIDGNAGHFVDDNGKSVADVMKFKVVDLEMIPAQERGQKFALHIEGTLLDEAAEQELRDEERQKWEARQGHSKPRSRQGTPMMSGGVTGSRAGSVGSS